MVRLLFVKLLKVQNVVGIKGTNTIKKHLFLFWNDFWSSATYLPESLSQSFWSESKFNSIDQRWSNVISGSDPFEISKYWCSVTSSHSGPKRMQDDNSCNILDIFGFFLHYSYHVQDLFSFEHILHVYMQIIVMNLR